MSYTQNTTNEESLSETKLHIKLTNKGMLIYGGWSNERLLNLLKDKLVRCNDIKSSFVCTDDASRDKSLHFVIHSGMYPECILLELEGRGMPSRSIVKAMKFGLLGLIPEELKYFENFGAKVDTDTWTKRLDDKLIGNLAATGLTENQCWSIVTCGLASQDECTLYRLLSSGIDVPGILDWQGKVKSASSTIIRFLKSLGMDEGTCNYVKENGVDEEAEDILIDLGYNEYKEKEALDLVTEEILCECSLTILESRSIFSEEKSTDAASNNLSKTSCDLSKTAFSSIYTATSTQYAKCTCYLNLLPKERNSKVLKRNDYLRQYVMVPLSWALSRALRYHPTDPIHYIAYQLLRWKYGNVSQEEMQSAQQFVASATIIMDQKLMQKYKCEEKNAVRRLNKTAVKDMPCDVCLERQKLHRIKQHCWKCIRVPISQTN
ncbi:uncharacterized protein LOC105833044 [Monomorium pharaonis]|uniref:uncharacterized protein LOC105833044 n=1 Tax=Monomorium pharaonis TaxID=307658 RepID=UPI001746C5F9|nr:uncharacterized protein LOC105833044 [Monomorium pharaonis]